MELIFDFMGEHPWQTFFILVFFGGGILNLILYMWRRLLGTINICVRGWPPEHLDADGDFKEEDSGDE